MKKFFICLCALCLCISVLASCAKDGETDVVTSDTSALTAPPDTQNPGGDNNLLMKDITINGKYLKDMMVVTDFSGNPAGKQLANDIKKGTGAQFVLTIGEEQLKLYPNIPYIQIISLPVNGMSEDITDTQAHFFEENGNFKIILGSRKITESAAASYFVNNILLKNNDLTAFDLVADIAKDDTLYGAIADAEQKAAAIVNKENLYETSTLAGGAKRYYVSFSEGNNSNDGLSPQTPWKTISKVNAQNFNAGDVVLFKRGDIWRLDDSLEYPSKAYLTLKSGVTYSSYGEGAKPAIYGSPVDAAKEGTWTKTAAPNVWKYEHAYSCIAEENLNDVGSVIFNGGEIYGYKMIENHSEMPFGGALSDLKENYQFWYNRTDDHVYLYFDGGNPGEVFDSIEMGLRMNMVSASGSERGGEISYLQDVIFDNFCIKYGGAHAVSIGLSKNVQVTNCEIGWMGGGVLDYNVKTGKNPARYGNGIQIGRATSNITADSNYIYQIYDAALTHQFDSSSATKCEISNITYSNNVVEYCWWGIEYYVHQQPLPEDADEQTYQFPLRKMTNITISGNSILYTGYGWGYWRPESGQPGAAHIKAWHAKDASIEDGTITVENNKLVLSKFDVVCTTADNAADLPEYSANTFIQYSNRKTLTVSTTEIKASDRDIWDVEEIAENTYLKDRVNTYYTVE